VTNVRIVEDKLTRSPKGFGYVEFETVDGLKKALDLSGTTLQGRAIRVSIAEPRKYPLALEALSATKKLTASTAKERDVKELDWTRKGPLPAPDQPPRRVPDRSTFGRNLDNLSDAGSERGGGRRNFESDGKVRDFGNWERKGPLSPVTGPVREGGRPRSNEGPGFRRSSPAWGEGRSQDGSRPPRREFQERAPTAAELDNSWRARMRPDQPPAKEPSNPPSPAATPATPAAPAAPASRPKLNLQKRTVTDTPSSPAANTDSKASPFGGARPIDTAARERQVEERRQLALRQKKEAEEKAKAEKAEKQRQSKEQAKSEKPVPAADPNGKDSVDMPQGGKNFEILRRAGEDESGEAAEQDQKEEAPAAAAGDEASKQAPAGKANGNWRSGGPAQPAEAAADEEGWSTVSSKARNNRRGQSGRTFA
jgi:translation initiation factor 4B